MLLPGSCDWDPLLVDMKRALDLLLKQETLFGAVLASFRSGLSTGVSSAQSVAASAAPGGRTMMPPQVPMPIQLDDEVILLHVVKERHRGSFAVGLVIVGKAGDFDDDCPQPCTSYPIYTHEALSALSELLADSEKTSDTFTWADIIGIAVGYVPQEE